MTLKGAAATRRKRARKQPKTRAELIRARARYCEVKAPDLAPCDLEQGSFMRRDTIKLFKERILSDAIFPSKVTEGPKRHCTWYVTKDESTGEGLPPYSDTGSQTSRGPYVMWRYCDGKVEGDMGHKTKADAVRKAQRASGHDTHAWFKREKRRKRRARARKPDV